MVLGRTVSRGVLALVAVAALFVSMTSSVTRGDATFGLVAWLLWVALAAVGVGVVLALFRVGRRATGRPALAVRRRAFVMVLVVAAASFRLR
jgi:hypothetical protein